MGDVQLKCGARDVVSGNQIHDNVVVKLVHSLLIVV